MQLPIEKENLGKKDVNKRLIQRKVRAKNKQQIAIFPEDQTKNCLPVLEGYYAKADALIKKLQETPGVEMTANRREILTEQLKMITRGLPTMQREPRLSVLHSRKSELGLSNIQSQPLIPLAVDDERWICKKPIWMTPSSVAKTKMDALRSKHHAQVSKLMASHQFMRNNVLPLKISHMTRKLDY